MLRGRGRIAPAAVDEVRATNGAGVWTVLRPALSDVGLRSVYQVAEAWLFTGTLECRARRVEPELALIDGPPLRAATSIPRKSSAEFDISPRDFRPEYEASFESVERRVHYNFLREPWPTDVDASIGDDG
jgi:hypothetical protein